MCLLNYCREREREIESGKSVCQCVDECNSMAKGIIKESDLMHKPNSMEGMEWREGKKEVERGRGKVNIC